MHYHFALEYMDNVFNMRLINCVDKLKREEATNKKTIMEVDKITI